MFYISEIFKDKPKNFKTELQRAVYNTLEGIGIQYERVDTDEAITMDDCVLINKKLNVKMVKTLFLCNRHEYFLFVTCGDKRFNSKSFSAQMQVLRVSFAPEDKMQEMLGTKVGAATVFGLLFDKAGQIKIVFDKDVLSEEYYGCSDGTTTGYMKIRTIDVTDNFLPYTGHIPSVIEV